MWSIFDILGSSVLGAMLVLMAMTAMDRGIQGFINQNADAIVQNELTETTYVIQDDLRKMGYGIPEAHHPTILQVATPNSLRFIAHLNSESDYYASVHGNTHIDDIPDTIEYVIAAYDTVTIIDTTIVQYGITRTIKVSQETTKSGMIGSITNPAVFRYLDQIGNPVGIMSAVRMVEVTLVAANPNVYLSDEVLAAQDPVERMDMLRDILRETYWRQTRVISKNLRR
ncbi:hypothetical protein K8I28_04665 [bacterium]|nr:hypothetical protein [bacterium]